MGIGVVFSGQPDFPLFGGSIQPAIWRKCQPVFEPSRIVYWQASEIGRVLTEENPEADGIDTSLLEHVSPIEWENVVLYGEYLIDNNWIR